MIKFKCIIQKRKTQLKSFCSIENIKYSILQLQLPFLQVEILLTLFSKFFSTFLHSTFLLLISSVYLHFAKMYQHLVIHYQESRLQIQSSFAGDNGAVTHNSSFFESFYSYKKHLKNCKLYYFLVLSLFARRYQGNHCYFLLLSLLICLNLGGYPFDTRN